MFRTRSFAAILLGGVLAALPAFSQEGGRSDATVQAFGSFVKTTTDNGVQQGATNSGGVLASYRFFFSNNHGVEVNYGYSRNTQTYGLAAGPLGVNSNQHEVSAAYVYRHVVRHFTSAAWCSLPGMRPELRHRLELHSCTAGAPTSTSPSGSSLAPSIADWFTTVRPLT